MGTEESARKQCEVTVTLRSNTPVVGCEINPWVRVKAQGSLQAPQHNLDFTWYREHCACSVHHVEIATTQCMCCAALNIPVKESYHCSVKCFADALQNHLVGHRCAAEALSKTSNGNGLALGKLRRCGSWPGSGNGSSLDDSSVVIEREAKAWIVLGSSKTYTPSMDDFGFSLRLESVAIAYSTGIPLSPVNVTVTDPVIISPAPRPRCMIPVGSLKKSRNFNFEDQSFNGGSFSVLSYNILADLYASRDGYSYCPPWALMWEYRRQNLLNEIIGYNADILCLQEVQSDHFENFFKPKLAKRGYSVIYKKKTKEVYTANQYTIDGCATFFRSDRFKEIMKYELEFDKTAIPLVEALKPGWRYEGSIRLMKDNIALVVILETVENGSVHDAVKSRICVANTHIHANSNFPDAKLFQVVNFIKGLEKISHSQIPLVVCGDMNSLPGSDPHKFLVSGRIKPVHKKATDPLGIYQHLKLVHSMHLASAYSSLLHSGRVEEQKKKNMNPETKEPLFTNFKPGFSGTLDYIFYTERRLKVYGLLELLDYESLGGVALPSPLWSSDHIALMASFGFKPGYWRQQYSSTPPNPWEQVAPELQTLLMEEVSEDSE
uniref:poly(A)-specific ribonuclease n=1 Tax=Davidia involucrata TaxID=16924 RepID=A0A5B6YNW0_DAVIN